MDERLKEVISAIEKINNLLFVEDQEKNLLLENDQSFPLELSTSGNGHYIKVFYLGFCVWFNFEDDRKYDYEKDYYPITLHCHFLNKIRMINKAIGNISI